LENPSPLKRGFEKLPSFLLKIVAATNKSESFFSNHLREQKTPKVFPQIICGRKKLQKFFLKSFAGAKNSESFSSNRLREKKTPKVFPQNKVLGEYFRSFYLKTKFWEKTFGVFT
jgi:hypothetical protein